jgi:site-specific DNA-methyltransferase (adenine-specific)
MEKPHGIKSLYNSDCVQGIREFLSPKSIDVVVTSPPYNIGVKYYSYKDNLPLAEYLEWLEKWAVAVDYALKDDGSLFLNIGSKPTSPELPLQAVQKLTRIFRIQNVIHWIKSIYIENESYGEKQMINVGHYKPINSRRFLNDAHEYIFHLTKTGAVPLDRLALGVPYKDASNIHRWRAGRKNTRCRGNCWFIPYETIRERRSDRPHPASFPPQLAENCIKLHGLRKGMIVLDPFMGIGNTGYACKKLNVEFIGFELDPYYFKIAAERLA